MPGRKKTQEAEPETERLQKRIANSGFCSRRAAIEYIENGRVKVNGIVVREKGFRLTESDEVRVGGKVISAPRLITIMMNKPTGVLTTMHDPYGRPTVAQLLPDMQEVVRPVGRLDWDTEGLLLFTNDGDLAFRLTHPRYGVEKEYDVVVLGHPDKDDMRRLETGVMVEGRKTAPAKVFLDRFDEAKDQSILSIIIHEGRRRQVRQMFDAVGHPVITLRRVRIGPIKLGKLPKRTCKLLGKAEVDLLKAAVGLTE